MFLSYGWSGGFPNMPPLTWSISIPWNTTEVPFQRKHGRLLVPRGPHPADKYKHVVMMVLPNVLNNRLTYEVLVIEFLLRIVTNLQPFQLSACCFPHEVVVRRPLVVEVVLHHFDPATLWTRTPWARTSFQNQTFHKFDERVWDLDLIPTQVLKIATKIVTCKL